MAGAARSKARSEGPQDIPSLRVMRFGSGIWDIICVVVVVVLSHAPSFWFNWGLLTVECLTVECLTGVHLTGVFPFENLLMTPWKDPKHIIRSTHIVLDVLRLTY